MKRVEAEVKVEGQGVYSFILPPLLLLSPSLTHTHPHSGG